MDKMQIRGEWFLIGELVRLDNKKTRHMGRGRILRFESHHVIVQPFGHRREDRVRIDVIKKWKAGEAHRQELHR